MSADGEAELVNQFASYAKVLESESDKLAALKEHRKALDEQVRALQAAAQDIHS